MKNITSVTFATTSGFTSVERDGSRVVITFPAGRTVTLASADDAEHIASGIYQIVSAMREASSCRCGANCGSPAF